MYNIEEMKNTIICGDCLEEMKKIPDNSIDSIVTDPPAGINFMGKTWDDFTDIKNTKSQVVSWMNSGVKFSNKGLFAFQDFIYQVFSEAIRILKPGGHALVWALPRTSHHTAMGIERAGFEIRDKIYFIFGSGFPKSLNIGKKIDEIQGNKREVFKYEHWGRQNRSYQPSGNPFNFDKNKVKLVQYKSKGNSPWEGWGTALKPAVEEWILARKPISEKNVAKNILKWGTGGLNIDGCRVEATGRFPSHLILDGSEEVEKCFPHQKSGNRSSKYKVGNENGEMFNHGIYGKYKAKNFDDVPASEGSASRFFQHCPITKEDLEYNRIFYGSKASKKERNMGCGDLPLKLSTSTLNTKNGKGKRLDGKPTSKQQNNHPTVKPLSLMRYLCRLITPPKGIVLDMFAGSGSTLIAAKQEGFNYIGIERESDYVKIAEARLKAVDRG